MNPPPRRRDQPTEPPTVSGLVRFLNEHRAGLAALVVVVAAVLSGWMAWSQLGERVRGDADLVLHLDAIQLEGVAPWIRGDLKLEALRDASLADGLPLDDPELVRRLARAFDMRPWVREVVSVEVRHPAGARVQVRCREPVAMVGVPGGLLAIDAEGVVLPSDDFTAEVAAAYPKISGVASGPQGTVGFPWGDPVVGQGAALAAVLGPDWEPLGLIECRPTLGKEGEVQAWQLVGAAGRMIVFGSAPGHERPGEPTAATKIARLRALPKEGVSGTTVDLTTEPETPPAVPSIPAG